MSSIEPPRTAGTSARRPVNGTANKHRGPPSRVISRASPDIGSDILPQDSASNAPSRKPSSSQRPNGIHRTLQEKRIDTRRTLTTETERIRTRSPVKVAERPDVNGGSPSQADHAWRSKDRDAIDSHIKHSRVEPSPVIRPWTPQATLKSHTTAPLASRVSIPPSSSLVPEALRPTPLKQLSPVQQEAAIIEDLLYTFWGCEGQYITHEPSYDATSEKHRLNGPKFKIAPGLDPSLQDLTTTMLKMSTYYCAIETFIEVQSREEFGMISHALCASIRRLLKEYHILIAQLEHQFLTNNTFTLHVLHLQILPTMHKLFQLYTLAQEMLRKNKLVEEEIDDSLDDLEDDDILELLRDGGDLAPGSLGKKGCSGGNVLRLLTERLSFMSGDPAAREVLQGLLRDASRPYMAMLNEWLHRGGIKDPHSEFMIREQKTIKRDKLEEDFTDEYWEKRYTLRDHEIPPQLEAVRDKVLLAGKYLNVVRECGGVDISTEVKDVPHSFEDPRLLYNVNAAYAHANSSLLKLLLTTHALPDRLRSLKHYFFLDRADFFSYFLHLSKDELNKRATSINVGKLQSLLDIVLRQPGSIAAQDPYKEDVKIHMNNQYLSKFLMSVVNVQGYTVGEYDDALGRQRTPAERKAQEAEDKEKSAAMTGFSALEFKYSVPFPLSLVISSKTVIRYQILFRYLLAMRHLENAMVTNWEEQHKTISWTNRSGDRRIELFKRRTWNLRARMLNFVQQFVYYCTHEVIEPNWNKFMKRVYANMEQKSDLVASGAEPVNRTVDELMRDHVDFLDTCLKECMLMNSRLLKIYDKLIAACTLFASSIQVTTRMLFTADKTLAGTPKAVTALTSFYPLPQSRTRQVKSNPLPIGKASPVHSQSQSSSKTSTPQIPSHRIPEKFLSYNPNAMDEMEDKLNRYESAFNRHIELLLVSLDYFAAAETVTMSKLCALLSGCASEKKVSGIMSTLENGA
ncbi:hypothetical protein MMC25_000666 [Agyrium rufum]|nr:hypothetical protein [Agyrium rufum]